jgi:hypothetical protein
MKKELIFILIFLMVFSLVGIYADDNVTVNQTSDNTTINQTSVENVSTPIVPNIALTNFMPQETKIGDIQFNLQIQNNENTTINNTSAFVTGEGFSTYNIVPVDSLAPGDKSYIFIMGNLKEAGNITLTIQINDETFYQNITVIDPNASSQNQQQLDNIQQAQETEQQIKNISNQLDILKQNYSSLETELNTKQADNYDVSSVSLSDLKSDITKAQTGILSGDVVTANVNLELAYEEYSTQRSNLDNAKKVSFMSMVKNNVVLFSTFAGAIITFFALFELLKKKKDNIGEIVSKKITKKEEEKKE